MLTTKLNWFVLKYVIRNVVVLNFNIENIDDHAPTLYASFLCVTSSYERGNVVCRSFIEPDP